MGIDTNHGDIDILLRVDPLVKVPEDDGYVRDWFSWRLGVRLTFVFRTVVCLDDDVDESAKNSSENSGKKKRSKKERWSGRLLRQLMLGSQKPDVLAVSAGPWDHYAGRSPSEASGCLRRYLDGVRWLRDGYHQQDGSMTADDDDADASNQQTTKQNKDRKQNHKTPLWMNLITCPQSPRHSTWGQAVNAQVDGWARANGWTVMDRASMTVDAVSELSENSSAVTSSKDLARWSCEGWHAWAPVVERQAGWLLRWAGVAMGDADGDDDDDDDVVIRRDE